MPADYHRPLCSYYSLCQGLLLAPTPHDTIWARQLTQMTHGLLASTADHLAEYQNSVPCRPELPHELIQQHHLATCEYEPVHHTLILLTAAVLVLCRLKQEGVV